MVPWEYVVLAGCGGMCFGVAVALIVTVFASDWKRG